MREVMVIGAGITPFGELAFSLAVVPESQVVSLSGGAIVIDASAAPDWNGAIAVTVTATDASGLVKCMMDALYPHFVEENLPAKDWRPGGGGGPRRIIREDMAL